VLRDTVAGGLLRQALVDDIVPRDPYAIAARLWCLMNVALWIAQGLLVLVFFGAGFTKLKDDRLTYARTRPPMTSYAEDLSDRTFKSIGVLEVLGAVGLVLPQLTGIAPALTPLAALGFVGLMIGAIVTHVRRGEQKLTGLNVVLMLLALFAFWGRGVEVLLGNDAGA
jgi:uncharacterized membrane protein YphA (DoxX/SURF4 family)